MNKNLQYWVLLLLISFLSACSGNKSGNDSVPGSKLISSNLEDLCWMNQFTLVKDVAHSGKFSSKLDSINQFSFGYSNTFNNISDTLPLSVDVDVWVYYPQTGINSSVVLSIDSVGKNIYWKGIPLKDSISVTNQWKQIKGTFEIPKKIMPTDNIKIYVWSSDKKSFYMDDLKLVFHNL
jgi:hypothetical protein